MKHWFGSFLLVAIFASAGCESLQPSGSSGVVGTTQTGTNIPHVATARTAQPKAKREATAKQAKAKTQKAPTREVDESFVTRGGFR